MDEGSNVCNTFSDILPHANTDKSSGAISHEMSPSNSVHSSTIMNEDSNACNPFSNNSHDANKDNLSDATGHEIPQSNSVKNRTSFDDLSNSCKPPSSVKIGCLKRIHMCPELHMLNTRMHPVKQIHQASEDVNSCVQLVYLKNVQRQLSQ